MQNAAAGDRGGAFSMRRRCLRHIQQQKILHEVVREYRDRGGIRG
jgi:hypothetical protein